MSDGSYQAIITMHDQHYTDEHDNLQNIDTDLYDEADFDVMDFPVGRHQKDIFHSRKALVKAAKEKRVLDRNLYDFYALKVPFASVVPRNFKKGYSIGKGENKLIFKPVGASASIGQVVTEQRNKIEYQDAWNDSDVFLEVTDRGIKETIILKTDRAPSKFTFEVVGPLADDLTAGEMLLENAWLQDAQGTKRDVAQTVIRENGKVYIDLVADVTGLAYPIEIDPTVTNQSPTDTYVYSSSTQNYSAQENFWAGRDGGQTYRSFIKFDLSNIPSNAYIQSAGLDLYVDAQYDTTEREVDLYVVTSAWSAPTVTYANQPSVGLNEVTRVISALGTVNFAVTNGIANWVSGAVVNNGYSLRGAEGVVNTYKRFSSSENITVANRPKLTITYNTPPTAPVVTYPNGGETLNSLHTITWNAATDPESVEQNISFSTNGSGDAANSTQALAQTFTTPNTTGLKLTKLKFKVTTLSTNGNMNVKLFAVDANGFPTGDYLYSTLNATVLLGEMILDWGSGVALSANTRYAIVVESIGSSAFNLGLTTGLASRTNQFRSYKPLPSGAWTARSTEDFAFYLYYSSPANLQYNIELTTDDGGAWKTLVALTSVGATSYPFDFINEAESSTAKIRIRAYDGAIYGPYDESNGVFTIQHNQAPTAPTNLSPVGGIAIDRAQVNRLSWQHNDGNGDPQSKFDLQWRPVGTGTWNTVTQVTLNQYWDAPANTFPRGNIEWQVRTYDQADLSGPYSAQGTFFAGDKPASATITSPADSSTVALSKPSVEWSSSGQTAYQLKVKNALDSTIHWDSGEKISANKAITVGLDLENNKSYINELTIKNADGLYSDPTMTDFTVSFTPPAVPTIDVTSNDGYLNIAVTNPVPSGTEPIVSTNDIYRRVLGQTEWIRIQMGIALNGSYSDYAVASEITYEYKVRANGDNGTYSDSAVGSSSLILTAVYLHDVKDPVGTVHRFKYDGSGRDASWQPEATMMQFAGRTRPVAEFGESEEGRISVQLQMLRSDLDYSKLQTLIKSKSTLCYRDGRGRKMFGVVLSLPERDETFGYTKTIEVIETAYSEVV